MFQSDKKKEKPSVLAKAIIQQENQVEPPMSQQSLAHFLWSAFCDQVKSLVEKKGMMGSWLRLNRIFSFASGGLFSLPQT